MRAQFIPLKIRDTRRRLYLHSVGVWTTIEKEPKPHSSHHLWRWESFVSALCFRYKKHLLNEDKFLRQYVGHQPIILPGSAVIILNNANEVLLQKRYEGGWGLPGGLMELGESLEDTAKREVFEETGLTMQIYSS
ncbi:NUDIX domain-containing protein [Lysinibacillus pakistanensis]|uniref:NUDIX domain-containing protein n=1 Tax=Lysinibacillus pakistanensis TaxID=759811 RepID=UPI003221F4A4